MKTTIYLIFAAITTTLISCTDDINNNYYIVSDSGEEDPFQDLKDGGSSLEDGGSFSEDGGIPCVRGIINIKNSIEQGELYPYSCIEGNLELSAFYFEVNLPNLEYIEGDFTLHIQDKDSLKGFNNLNLITDTLLIVNRAKEESFIFPCDVCDLLSKFKKFPEEINIHLRKEDEGGKYINLIDECTPKIAEEEKDMTWFMDFDRDCKAYLADK